MSTENSQNYTQSTATQQGSKGQSRSRSMYIYIQSSEYNYKYNSEKRDQKLIKTHDETHLYLRNRHFLADSNAFI